MPRRAPIALLLAFAATAILVAPASALTIHQHRMVPRVVGGVDAGSPIVTQREIVRVKSVAPADSDDDGCPDASDSYNGPGCNPPPPPPATSVTGDVASTTTAYGSVTSTSAYSDVPGVPSSFAACVALRESSNGAGSSNIYGIIPASGSDAGSGTIEEQKAAFSQLYSQYGTEPWSPYDGCTG